MTADLFDDDDAAPERLHLSAHAVVLRRFARAHAAALLQDMHDIASHSPWRHMVTPGGKPMSVATTGCGDLGWVSDVHGYRYSEFDPLTGAHWPALPARWLQLAHDAAQAAGFANCAPPDACLINRYAPGARMGLHQDKDEIDLGAPIISVSLGLPARFLWGGNARGDRHQNVPLMHGDVLVWGGADRLRFHGVGPLAEGIHPLCGAFRYNLTLRKAR